MDSSAGSEADAARVLEIERAAAATWPASTVQRVSGWTLRHCRDLDRCRSNSALPPPRIVDLGAEVDRVVDFYAERCAHVAVQVSPLRWHAELDAYLAGRGFALDTPVHVMTAAANRVAAAAAPAADVEVRLDEEPTTGWLAASHVVGGRSEPGLARIDRPARYVTALCDGEPAGVGLFVAEGSWCAVYCMATAPSARGRGVARSVLHAGARWAGEADAGEMFLQVEVGNAVARRLYGGCGFAFSHEYHYRVAEIQR